MLSLLVMLVSSTAWADPQSAEFDSSTKVLKFNGDGIINTASITNLVQSAWKQQAISVTFGEGITGIANSAFEGFPALKTVTIPANIETIESFAFYNCYNLTTFTIQDGSSPLTFGQYAIHNADDLMHTFVAMTFTCYRQLEVKLLHEDSVGEGKSMFSTGNKYISKVILGGSMTSIPDYAFTRSVNLTTVSLTNATSITKIGAGAFMYCPFTSITLPTSVTEIGESAFESTKFTTINSAKLTNLDKIGKSAFKNSALTKFTIPSKVASIRESVFENSNNLTEVTHGDPGNIKTLGASAFKGTRLSSFDLNSRNLTKIGNSAFEGTALTSIELPARVSNIGASAFKGCSLLKSINIPTALTTIGESAFQGCSSLTFASLDLSKVTSIGQYAFCNTGLTSVSLNSDLTEIPEGLFQNSKLTSIEIPSGVTSIGAYAFQNSKLTAIAIPAEVTIIGEKAFQGCDDVTSIAFEAGPKELAIRRYAFAKSDGASTTFSFNCGRPFVYTRDPNTTNYGIGSEGLFYSSKVSSVVLGSYVTTIPDYTFCYSNQLTSANLTSASSLTSIGKQAFYNSKLTTVYVPSKVTSIGERAYSGCNDYTLINIADGTSELSIGTYAFTKHDDATVPFRFECGRPITYSAKYDTEVKGSHGMFYKDGLLTQVTTRRYVTTIPIHSFEECEALSSATIYTDALTRIGNNAFSKSGLTSLTLTSGNGQLTIGSNAFAYTKLTSIAIPANVVKVEGKAFYGCNYLESISFNAGATSLDIVAYGFTKWGNTNFTFNCNRPFNYTDIPASSDDSGSKGLFYKNTLLTGVTLGSNVKTIPSQTFEDCSALSSVTLNSPTLTTIGYASFKNCQNLASFTMPSTLTSLGAEAFYGTAIKNAEIPSVTSLGNGVFENCNSLASAKLSSSLTSIPNRLFYGCSALTEIGNNLPSGLTSIGDDAFYATGLTSITIPNTVTSIGKAAFSLVVFRSRE